VRNENSSLGSGGSRKRLASTCKNPESQYKRKSKSEVCDYATGTRNGWCAPCAEEQDQVAVAKPEEKKFTPEKMMRLQRTEERSKTTRQGACRLSQDLENGATRYRIDTKPQARCPVAWADQARGKSQHKRNRKWISDQ
jgi:hypothetical protein